jgi:Rrf2 family nitric oxide-sensitive transcriptional repressor
MSKKHCHWESGFMRLTTKTNLAARVLMACAVNDKTTLRSAEIAQTCNASLNHLLQVVSALQANGFVETIRGRNGGLRLARSPAEISMGEVFRIFEAGVPFAECFAPETNTCPLSLSCRLRSFVSRAIEAFYHELDMVTLADLTKGNCGLAALLSVPNSLRSACTEASMA